MGALALAAVVLPGGQAGALGAAEPVVAASVAAQFGARETIRQISLSPNGKQIAIVAPLGEHGSQLMVLDAVSAKLSTVLTSAGDPTRLSYCQWSTDVRLVCSFSMIRKDGGDRIGFDRLVTLKADGSDLKILTARPDMEARGLLQDGGTVIDWVGDAEGGSALMTRTFLPNDRTGSLTGSSDEGLGVERVNTTTLKRQVVERPRPATVGYVSDGHGTVRIMAVRPRTNDGYMGARVSYLYRKPNGRDWELLSATTSDGGTVEGFVPYAVDRDANVAYGFDNKDGRTALFKVALDGTLKRDLVMARPDVDVDGLIQIGRQHRVVGASWATEKRETAFFDPALAALRLSIGRALPGTPLVTVVDASADENTLLLFAGSDVDPGRYYLLDRKTRHMEEVLPTRPQLAGMKLATVKPVTFPAADGTPIPGYLTLPAGPVGKGLPAIVMPHGGPGARDEWGFDWLSQFFAARGFAVLQPNFRGSTGYGSAWFQQNGFRSWKTAVGDVDDAGRWLVKQGLAAPSKLAIVGWSYGGYAALQSAVLDPGLFKAVIAVAPVTDLETLRAEAQGFTSFRLVDAFIGRGSHVREGSPARNADRIKVPVLLFHGDMDQNVGIGESRLMADRLRDAGGKVELVEFKGLDHQLDDSAARTKMLDRSDTFLKTALALP